MNESLLVTSCYIHGPWANVSQCHFKLVYYFHSFSRTLHFKLFFAKGMFTLKEFFILLITGCKKTNEIFFLFQIKKKV